MMDSLPGKNGEVQGSLASHSKCEPLFDSSFNKQILTTIKSPLNLLNEMVMSLFVLYMWATHENRSKSFT